MTQMPGWYHDPYAAEPGTLRYWDGSNWTSDTRLERVALQDPSAPYGHVSTSLDTRLMLPDGTPIASWGRRLGGYLIDVLVLLPVSAALMVGTGAFDAMNDFMAATATGSASVALPSSLMFALSMHTILTVLVTGAYTVVMHTLLGQTVGKMAVGIRVRMRETEAKPSWNASIIRWLVSDGVMLVGQIAIVGAIVTFFWVLNHLWPLWSPTGQAIHDRAARTNVVRVARRGR